MFDVSLPWANFWYNAFNIILFVGAFAVAVGTYGSIKFGSIKESFANERISANEAATAVANADAENAKKDSAQANERAAEANARAKEAELALERFKAPRKLSKGQLASLTGKMIPYNGKQFDMAIVPGDSEVADLMSAIESALNSAGLKQIN